MLGKLIPCGGGIPVRLLKTALVLGRRPDCDIKIPCASVSGRHCLLQFEEGWWWVRDLESKNGTAVNGQRIVRQRVAPQNIISVGRQRLVLDYQPVMKPTLKESIHDEDEELAIRFLNSEVSDLTGSRASLQTPLSHKPPQSDSVVPTEKTQVADHFDLGKLVPGGGGASIPLRSPELILGRGSDCDVQVRFSSVSSRHCKLSFDEGYWLVEDLNSRNGTWVDGERCLRQVLMPESELSLGKHALTIHYSPRGDGPPPAVRKLFSQSLLEKAGLADQFFGDRLGRQKLPEDELDRPKRYNLLSDTDDE